MTPEQHKQYRYSHNYQKRKLVFWILLSAGFVIAFLWILFPHFSRIGSRKHEIQAGICGEVVNPGIYTCPEGADLAMLIRRAGGLTSHADIRNIDLDYLIFNDSIYHIPARLSRRRTVPEEDLFIDPEKMPFVPEKQHAKPFDDILDYPEIRQLNILYSGDSRTFILINYFPDYKLANLLLIPYTTVLYSSGITLQDLFFTQGVQQTMRVLENQFSIKIDHYLIQQRGSFIDMIDSLKGVEVKISEEFAASYNLTAGTLHLDGHHAWEFIRFMGHPYGYSEIRSFGLMLDPYRSPAIYKAALITRHHNHHHLMQSMQESFKQLNSAEQILGLYKLYRSVETDVSLNTIWGLYWLYQDITGPIRVSYGLFPGYYDDETFYYLDTPSYNKLKQVFIREQFKSNPVNKKQ